MKIKLSKKQWEAIGNKAGWRTAEQVAPPKTINLKVQAVVEKEFCSSDCPFLESASEMCLAFQTYIEKKFPTHLPKTMYPQNPAPIRCQQCLDNEIRTN